MRFHFVLLALLTSIAASGCDTSSSGSPLGTGGAGSTSGATGGRTQSSGGSDASSGGRTVASGGTSSSSGGSDPGTLPKKSAGCGKSSPETGARTLEIAGQTGNFLLSVPSSYSRDTAYPLGFAFHGFGRTHEDCRATDCAGFHDVMKEEAVLVYMKSFTEGWELPAIREQNVDFFKQVLDFAKSELCIDESKVFVAGTSSGAHFTNVLACRFGDQLLAAAPVAGYLPERENCIGNVALVAIHGIDDPHVKFDQGETTRDFFREQNGCSTTTTPDLAAVHAEIRSSRTSMLTNQAFVDYSGCDPEFPVRWCEHSQGGYDNSTHGWPSAGGQLIWDFVSSL